MEQDKPQEQPEPDANEQASAQGPPQAGDPPKPEAEAGAEAGGDTPAAAPMPDEHEAQAAEHAAQAATAAVTQAGTPAPTPTPRPRPNSSQLEPDETVKETIESIIIAFILAFVFRAFIVEPFIIPTGSMAPTMMGAHLTFPCSSCGYRFDVGVDIKEYPEGSPIDPGKTAACPMCNYPVFADLGTRVRSGDRILVDKFSYHFKDPSRWDVVVFKAPQADSVESQLGPRTNFIKRLVALPGERVALLDGNVFVSPAGKSDFRIARKPDPEANKHWESIQRACWQPIYHSQYVPIESGRADGPGRNDEHAWRVPWQPMDGSEKLWNVGTVGKPKRVYTFKGGEGELRFEFNGKPGTMSYNSQGAKFPYNNADSAGVRSTLSNEPIEDIRLACSMTPETGQATLRLSTTARLDKPENGPEVLAATVSSDGTVMLSATTRAGKTRQLGLTGEIDPLKLGVAVNVELWFVDDEASVWVNGERIIVQRFDLTWRQIAERSRQRMIPDVRVGVESDGPVELRRIELDRDLYFYTDGQRGDGELGRAGARRENGKLVLSRLPVDLRTETDEHDAELFVLGDNQPESKDSRKWDNLDGWVRQRYLNDQMRLGVVPRSLLVGRAFMVYYPAPHGSSPQAKGVFPDFGRMRFVH